MRRQAQIRSAGPHPRPVNQLSPSAVREMYAAPHERNLPVLAGQTGFAVPPTSGRCAALTEDSSIGSVTAPTQFIREDSAMPETARQSLTSLAALLDSQSTELAQITEELAQTKAELSKIMTDSASMQEARDAKIESQADSIKALEEQNRGLLLYNEHLQREVQGQETINKEQESVIDLYRDEYVDLDNWVKAMPELVRK